MKRWLLLLIFLAACPARAEFSGTITDSYGVVHSTGHDPATLMRIRLVADWKYDLSAQWHVETGGSAFLTRVTPPHALPAPPYNGNPYEHWWRYVKHVETDPFEGAFCNIQNGERYFLGVASLHKAFLQFTRRKWDISLGRVSLEWGESHFTRPTSVFRPIRPLDAFGDPVAGSNGADVRYTLAANTVLEGAWRRLREGSDEWVVRLENQGIGMAGTPLYVHRLDGDGLGAEISATFKHFQVRAEGVGWRREGVKGRRLGMVAGFGAVIREFPVNVEFLRDGTGEVLGAAATKAGEPYSYAVLGVETPNFYRLRFSPTYARAFEGGRHMAKAKLLYEFSRRFEMGAETMWFWGECPGPLGDFPSSAWGYLKLSL